MGAVYLATHRRLGSEAAVKVVHAHIATDRGLVARFETEAQAVARIDHNNIVKAFDFGVLRDGRPYFIMERLRGRPLHDELAAIGRMELSRALNVLKQLAAGMTAAHDAGVLHRDLKPSNVFLIEEVGAAGPLVKLLDFGLAKLWRESPDSPASHAGTILGTPEYSAPEQARGDPVDGRTDLYSIGIMLWEMLIGRAPFGGAPGDVIASQIRDTVPDVRTLRAGVPEPVAALTAKLLEKEPVRRVQSAAELLRIVDQLCRANPSEADAPARASAARSDPLPVTPRKRVLVVEDDGVNARVLFDFLGAHGYDVAIAKTGSEGLDEWRRTNPDLLVVDVLLPVKNGFELCQEVKRAPGARHTPVILMSAVYRHPERDPAYAHRVAGADAYFCKPFELRDLLARVRALLGDA